ncbi:uncharacterized protein [Onthophagus taurus]|uniref:uncharacterized protein isoform X2 n=1 Tax=Onthophagus taurus TaxID=166361 RepID=UPI000C203338|nr:uncharacterized protein LOC111423917 [Onthophagus taurus]
MRSEKNNVDSSCRVPGLSIVIDDFDSAKESSNNVNNSKDGQMAEISLYQPQQRPYSRQSSDASIKKILEEAEHRKNEFWKLIDEHREVVENLKKIEQEHHTNVYKLTPTPITS